MDYNDIFAKRLQEAMETRSMTSAELARKADIDEATISRYRRGAILPHRGTLGKIAAALDVLPGWLVGETDVFEPSLPLNLRVSKAEASLVKGYRKLARADKRLVDDYVKFLINRHPE